MPIAAFEELPKWVLLPLVREFPAEACGQLWVWISARKYIYGTFSPHRWCTRLRVLFEHTFSRFPLSCETRMLWGTPLHCPLCARLQLPPHKVRHHMPISGVGYHHANLHARWRRVWQPCCELRENFAVFRMFICFFLLFYVLDVVRITVYDRDTLLNIGSSVAQRKPDLSSWMPVDCSQTPHQSPLSGPRNRGNAADAEKEERKLAFSSDWDAVLSDLLSQQFCWITFSHWITNSANCVRASHTNEKQGTAVLFVS